MLAKKKIKIAVEKREKKEKTPKQIEKHVKGVANHRRIEILFLIADSNGIDVEDISKRLHCNFKTISAHLLRLTQAGLIRKNNKGRAVIHKLSPYGQIFYKFLKTFQHS